MAMESLDVRLARLEEIVVASRADDREMKRTIATNHAEVMGALAPIQRQLGEQSKDITTLKRDRFWIFTGIMTAIAAIFHGGK